MPRPTNLQRDLSGPRFLFSAKGPVLLTIYRKMAALCRHKILSSSQEKWQSAKVFSELSKMTANAFGIAPLTCSSSSPCRTRAISTGVSMQDYDQERACQGGTAGAGASQVHYKQM